MPHKLVVGNFSEEETLLSATCAARDEGLDIFDTFTPYAIHGLDEAMGLKRSRLGIVCFFLGLIGLILALWFQLWISTTDWPLNIGGKSFAALPALIPIAFEVTVLFAAVGTVIVLFYRARLWPGKEAENLFPDVTDNVFVLAITQADDSKADMNEWFRDKGAFEIREVEIAR